MSRIFIAGPSVRPPQHFLICILLARSPPSACSDTRHSASSPDVLETTGSRPTWWSWWRASSPLFRYRHPVQPSLVAIAIHCIAQYNAITIVGGDNRIMSRSLNICEHEVIGLNIFSVSPSRLCEASWRYIEHLLTEPFTRLPITGYSPASVHTGYCEKKDRECGSGIRVQWISNSFSWINSKFSGPIKARPADCDIPSHLQSFHLGYLYVWSSESWRISSSSKWSQKTM